MAIIISITIVIITDDTCILIGTLPIVWTPHGCYADHNSICLVVGIERRLILNIG